MPRRARATGEHAKFVFKGTVRKLKAATTPEVSITPRTAIVRVDEVIEAPELLAHLAGQEITVQLEGGRTPRRGEQYVFHANSWLFGETVAVQAIERHPVVAASPMLAAAAGGDPVQRLADRVVQARYDAAQIVASGRVVSVSLAPAALGAAAMTAAETVSAPDEPLSEHIALWRDAVIELHAVHKGSHSGKQATVRFPASTDVMWYTAPKFHAGQEGLFMLHKGELKDSSAPRQAEAAGGRRGVGLAAVAGAPSEDTFTALHPADFQPLDQPGGIRQAIASSPVASAAGPST